MSGDIGGTNSRLSLWNTPKSAKAIQGAKPEGELLFEKKYLNENYPGGMPEICGIFLKEAQASVKCDHSIHPEILVLACAGPIINNTVNFTNVHFKVDGAQLAKKLNIPEVTLMNDFVAQGHGVLTLAKNEYKTLFNAPTEKGAPISVVGAGTGLGECYLASKSEGIYECYPSEGGHADWSVNGDYTFELFEFLKKKYGYEHRISVERVVSGPGLSDIYEFLSQKYPEKVNQKIHDEWINAGSLKGGVVGRNAKKYELCDLAMKTFVRAYAHELSNVAIKYLPRGGLFIVGGLAPKNIDYFTEKSFIDVYSDRGRVSPALDAVPLHLVLVEDVGERGAYFYAVQRYQMRTNNITVGPKPDAEKCPVPMPNLALAGIVAATAAITALVVKKL